MKGRPTIPRRSLLLHGLRLVVAHPGALLWTYAFNVGLALLFSVRLHAQFADVLNHSLAAERLNTAFDAGTLAAAIGRVSHDAPSSGLAPYLGLPLYFAIYFLLVPGTLFCYQTEASSGLRTLLSAGLAYFWRFVRITLFTLVLFAAVLAPLISLQAAWSRHVEAHVTGISAVYQKLPGILLIVLAAALLRLYCDLVEVYSVQLGERDGPAGGPDRRMRRTLLPALRTLRQNLLRSYASFLTLWLGGLAAVFFTGRIAVHMLAQPRVWPMFLLAQAGLFLLLTSRTWQRGTGCVLALENPLFAGENLLRSPRAALADEDLSKQRLEGSNVLDPQPDPEPAAPSLSEPDPGIFHRDLQDAPTRSPDGSEEIR